MALNYSQRSIFPAHLSEDKLVHRCSKEDIDDILPVDPFGMDISSTVTAITGWLQDLGVSNYGGCRRDEVGVGRDQYPIIDGWDLMWDTAMDFRSRMSEKKTDGVGFGDDRFDGFVTKGALERFVVDSGIGYGYDCFSPEDDVVFGCGDAFLQEKKNAWTCSNLDDRMFVTDRIGTFFTEEVLGRCPVEDGVYRACETVEVDGVVDAMNDGSPHSALSFALAYLGVRDLLSVERVCKSLQFTIRSDPLLWKSIQFNHPLNERVTDDVLLQLTGRAQGHLQCLSLAECTLVTDDGLRRVLEGNLRLTKLSVSGCIKVSIGCLMSCLKTFQPKAVTGIKCLRVAGRPVTVKQFEELTSLLGVHNHVQALQPNHHKPHFYSRENLYLSCEDDRVIDLEICPKCEMAKLVYDCTAQSCQGIDQVDQLCRACIHCIRRCDQCGRCIDGVKYVETFYLSYQCSDCSPEMSNCQMGQDIGSRFSEDVVSCELDG